MLTGPSKIATTYGNTFAEAIAQIAKFVQDNMAFLGLERLDGKSDTKVRVLDYACGPGTMTSLFLDYATELVGLDISQNMISRYNDNFKDHTNVAGFIGNLLDPDGVPEALNDKSFREFDLVIISGGFHHFPDVGLAARRLAERLRTGGMLVIVDFKQHQPDDIGDHPDAKMITKHGFSHEEMRLLLASNGISDVGVIDAPSMLHFNGISRRPFLARGTR